MNFGVIFVIAFAAIIFDVSLSFREFNGKCDRFKIKTKNLFLMPAIIRKLCRIGRRKFRVHPNGKCGKDEPE